MREWRELALFSELSLRVVGEKSKIDAPESLRAAAADSSVSFSSMVTTVRPAFIAPTWAVATSAELVESIQRAIFSPSVAPCSINP